MEETKIDIAPPQVIIKPRKPKILLHEPDQEFQIRTCCGPTTSCDKPLMEFMARFLISTSVLGFCFIQLSRGAGDSSYLSATISLILGTFLGNTPMPPAKKDRR